MAKKIKVLDNVSGVEQIINVSSLASNGTLTGSDLMLIEQSNTLKKVSITDLSAEFGGGGGDLINIGASFNDCENTTSEIDIVAVTITIGSVAIGDIIVIEYTFDRLSNTGLNVNITTRLKNGTNNIWSSTNASTNGSTVYKISHKIKFFVESIISNIVTLRTLDATGIAGIPDIQTGLLVAIQNSAGVSSGTITNNTFDNTAGTTLKITAQWASANANLYIRVKQATAYIIKNSL